MLALGEGSAVNMQPLLLPSNGTVLVSVVQKGAAALFQILSGGSCSYWLLVVLVKRSKARNSLCRHLGDVTLKDVCP